MTRARCRPNPPTSVGCRQTPSCSKTRGSSTLLCPCIARTTYIHIYIYVYVLYVYCEYTVHTVYNILRAHIVYVVTCIHVYILYNACTLHRVYIVNNESMVLPVCSIHTTNIVCNVRIVYDVRAANIVPFTTHLQNRAQAVKFRQTGSKLCSVSFPFTTSHNNKHKTKRHTNTTCVCNHFKTHMNTDHNRRF